jgi:hypothetical protein
VYPLGGDCSTTSPSPPRATQRGAGRDISPRDTLPLKSHATSRNIFMQHPDAATPADVPTNFSPAGHVPSLENVPLCPNQIIRRDIYPRERLKDDGKRMKPEQIGAARFSHSIHPSSFHDPCKQPAYLTNAEQKLFLQILPCKP